MLRSNSKKALENIRAYILEQYNPEEYGLPETNDFREAARNMWEACKNEIIKHDKRRMSYYEFFVEWLSGLPSLFDSADYIYHCNAKKRLAAILEETEAEADKYTETEAETMLNRLIWREVSKVAL